jgi:Reverse transcriptase (RNA-dependent DNA polymerase)
MANLIKSNQVQETHINTNVNTDQNSAEYQTHPDSFYLVPVNEREIVTYINELRNTSAPGFDKIDTRTLKAIKSSIALPISHIVNLCFTTGVFPDIFKTAIIKPIYKKGEKTLLNNYRPISVLNNISKLIEKCIKHRLYSFMEYFRLFSPNQNGFRKCMGTSDAIMKFTEKIHKEIDNNKKTLAIFLDLAKAFDTVAHSILFNKLYSYGIRGIALDLIKSYLSNRNQYVEINETLSKPRQIQFGVPQGTVLGPLLFLIYINDLCNLKIAGTMFSFADDTVLLFSGNTWESVSKIAENEMGKVSKWLNVNLLTLNNEKSMYITFTPKKNTQPDNTLIKIHNSNCVVTNNTICNCHRLTRTFSTKYLGITIDQHLRWDHHVSTIVNKLRYCLTKFYTLRNILTLSNLKKVYYATVQSILQYGITGWGGAYDSHIKRLNTIQNKILKIILKKDVLYSTELLYSETEVLQVRKLYAKFLIKHTHNNTNSKDKAITDTRPINTRSKSSKNLDLIRVKKGITQRHGLYLGPKLYNSLPLKIRNSKSPKLFNKLSHEWLKKFPIEKIDNIINLKI